MAVKIRLTRLGDKGNPFYRVVAADGRCPRDGKFLEVIGTYNPLTEPAEVKINKDLAQTWLNNGATAIRRDFHKLMSNQSRIAAKAAGRAVDVSADDFDDAD